MVLRLDQVFCYVWENKLYTFTLTYDGIQATTFNHIEYVSRKLIELISHLQKKKVRVSLNEQENILYQIIPNNKRHYGKSELDLNLMQEFCRWLQDHDLNITHLSSCFNLHFIGQRV